MLPIPVGQFDNVHNSWKQTGDSTTSLREAYGLLEWSDEPPETFEEQVIRAIDTTMHPIKMADVALSMLDKKLSVFRSPKGIGYAEIGNDMLQYHILLRVAKHFLGKRLMERMLPEFKKHKPGTLDGGSSQEYAIFLAHYTAATVESAATPSAQAQVAQPARPAQVTQPAPAAASSEPPPNKLSFHLQGYNSKVKKAPTAQVSAPVFVESTASGYIGQEINSSLPLRQAVWKKTGDKGSPFAYELTIADAAAAQRYICKVEGLGNASLLLNKGLKLRFHYRGKDAYLVVAPPRGSRVDVVAPVMQCLWRVLMDWKIRGETHGYIALEKYFKDNRRLLLGQAQAILDKAEADRLATEVARYNKGLEKSIRATRPNSSVPLKDANKDANMNAFKSKAPPAPGQQPPRNSLASTQSGEIRRTGDSQSTQRALRPGSSGSRLSNGTADAPANWTVYGTAILPESGSVSSSPNGTT
ncbi:hypothetical protein CaCOL14_006608 [Colletotrichum acutatum]|uniref:Uncharacterized protein n=1 Tax=Glomerella acutata TaxID=27357 RepID=A0AAD8XLQ2_GLOAC|nr:uncharacterized protein BDZ83DRAFT_604480 [Colletotrichum acutatum]KAK1729634.1 hypothetical protein BDZ83DRAFT_604480 [Colletotrichum acutatum]